MLSRLSYAVKTCDEAMAQYDFTAATTACYNLWLYDLCDIYLVRTLINEEEPSFFLTSNININSHFRST